MLTLRRAPALVVQAPDLDEAQSAVVAYRPTTAAGYGVRAGSVLRVLGAPGTGKTSTAIEVVVDRVGRDGITADQCLVLTASRTAAADLRERITARIGGTTTEPLARTHQALGFGILRQAAALRGDASPRLLSGPEQDVILGELLAGHACREGKPVQWPAHMQAALPFVTREQHGARVRQAHEAKQKAMHAAQADLLAVVSVRQEAILLSKGLLE